MAPCGDLAVSLGSSVGVSLAVTSPILFHGPGAQNEALAGPGVLLGLYGSGEKGLGVAETREALALVEHPTKSGVLIFGPLDKASPEALDALLKTVEEPPDHLELRLFALEEGLVSPTIRSRCLRRFCSDPRPLDLGTARRWVAWALAGKVGELAEQVLASKSEEPLPSLQQLSAALVEHGGGELFVALWKALRELPEDPTRPEVFSALVAVRR